MRWFLRCILLLLIAMLLSSGAVVAAFLDDTVFVGASILWLVLPLTALLLIAAGINLKWFVPRFLFRRKYLCYLATAFLVSYLVPLAGIALERFARDLLGYGHRIKDYLSPWILVDSLSSAVLIFSILAGLSLAALYRRWKAQADAERRLTSELDSRISMIRERLNPRFIASSLDTITETVGIAPLEANRLIRALSDYLRRQLYELPGPRDSIDMSGNDREGNRGVDAELYDRGGRSLLESFLCDSHTRLFRHLMLQTVILVIACGALFDAPDSPCFSIDRFIGVMSFWLVLNIIAYGNVSLLFPIFLRRGKQKLYMVSVAVFILAVTIVSIFVQIATYEPSPYLHSIPWYVMVISTMGSMMSLGLFLGGTASLLALKEWVKGDARMAKLRSETSRCELTYLRRQVNPHFLFNILNNAGILTYDDPALARQVLGELRVLLDRQLSQTRRDTTTVGEEADFLRSYLSLEAIRHESFLFKVAAEDGMENTDVPTLLFIPFVENAVKHGTAVDGKPRVEVSFRTEGKKIRFECRNPLPESDDQSSEYMDDNHKSVAGSSGLGLSNTRRRLELLFGDDFSLDKEIVGNEFVITLVIPLVERKKDFIHVGN